MSGRVILQHRIFRADLKANPIVLYVFGDNERRVGLGGQAYEMRGEPNAVGVATLAAPGVFWSDADAPRQCTVINADMGPLFVALAAGRAIVFPLDGIGTGLADLANRSPKTFAHLQARVADLRSAANES
jgi:hypothetical protein